MPVIRGACLGIDLGTANCLVCTKEKGIVIREPSVIAYEMGSDRVLAIGAEAKRMIGKTPYGITTVRPLRDGVIADFGLTLAMMKLLIKRAMRSSIIARPKVVVCIPYGITEVEQRAVENAAVEAGAAGVALIEEPVAAAIGAGLPLRQCKGSMIVDIGGGTTEVAVVSGGGVAVSKSLRIAGDACDKAIAEYIRKKFNVLIGETTAEEIKIEIGSVHDSTDIGMLEVRGRNLATGLPSVFNIYSREVREAIAEPVGTIVDVIKATLEVTPPELCADLYDAGLTIAGGGALLAGFPRLLEEKTGLPVTLAKHPLDCVADGIVKVMNTSGYRGLLHVVHKG
ncbi:MAG: rod shape-determining protein [Eubacteriales bacterium]